MSLQIRRSIAVPLAMMCVVTMATACSNAANTQSLSTGSAPGVSATTVNVGALATLSGPLAADFAAIVPGVQAYLSWTNAHGGVNGRKIHLSNVVDDGGIPSNNATGARTLVQQDHVFAVVGVASFFFNGASFLAQSGTPTFGYATQSNWAGPKNLFAAYGSVVDDATSGPAFAYVAQQVHAKSVGVMAYDVEQSSGACQAGITTMEKAGIHVGFSDLSASFGGDMTPDALRMKQAGVDFVITCMDVSGNIQIARALHQNGMTNVSQLWLDGYNSSTLSQYSSIMTNTYFMVQHVPFQAPSQFPGVFPGMSTYLAAMEKYSPQDVQSEVAMEGWISAALFVQGLKNAGPHPTQQAVIGAINKLTDFTAGGVTTPVNWTLAHTTVTQPSCEAYVKTATSASGSPVFRVAFNQGHNPWVCLNYKGAVDLKKQPAPQGSPGT